MIVHDDVHFLSLITGVVSELYLEDIALEMNGLLIEHKNLKLHISFIK